MIIAVILGIVVGTAFSFGFILSYRQGIKDGRALKSEQPLSPIIQPLPKKEKQQNDGMSFIDQLNALASYQPQFTAEKEDKK